MDVFGGLVENFKPYRPEHLIHSYGERDGPVTVMTGMTYDQAGEPVDALIPAAATASVSEYLDSQGLETETVLLVADSDTFVGSDPDQRVETLERFQENHVPDYLNPEVRRSSELEDEEFRRIKRALGDRAEEGEEFLGKLVNTVPNQHREGDPLEFTEYALHQLATMARVNPDVKIGPSRENRYDHIARTEPYEEAADRELPMLGAYIPTVYSTGGEEVLPYKARSKCNPDERILLDDTPEEIARKLDQMPDEQVQNMRALERFARPNLARSLAENLGGAKDG